MLVKWIILIACAWWFGRLVRTVIQRLGRGGGSGPGPAGAAKREEDYKDLTGQKISDADFEEIQEE